MQLGKLDVSQADQEHSCKTAQKAPQTHQRVSAGKQNDAKLCSVSPASILKLAKQLPSLTFRHQKGSRTIRFDIGQVVSQQHEGQRPPK
ncbi:hypothetical protein MA20_22210 [Bradyrhizobium japonicum]|uniref:Uncharacterized protein n=1 Tax=Bradyrhizobium japonicum TaxID=375 RepID=A0A0A3XSE1_BRAJP|nr:hypothetical protein MA20_22210 [Bradyrhizobium japonicum]